jgi:integrase
MTPAPATVAGATKRAAGREATTPTALTTAYTGDTPMADTHLNGAYGKPCAGQNPPQPEDRPKERRRANGGRFVAGLDELKAFDESDVASRKNPQTVAELCEWYEAWADEYYRKPNGKPTGYASTVRATLERWRKICGSYHPDQTTSDMLSYYQWAMAEAGRDRRTINKEGRLIKLMYRCAAEYRMVSASTWHELQSVQSLKRGRSNAAEPNAIKPVAWETIQATLPHMSRILQQMVLTHWWCGARNGELVIMRPGDIDMSGDVWLYRPYTHKTEHHGHDRVIPLGPEAQRAIGPLIHRPDDYYIFRPCEVELEHRWKAMMQRETPMSCGNKTKGGLKMGRANPNDHYRKSSYIQAVKRACEAAGIKPHWTPNQIRHAAATRLRQEMGIEAARIVLGHQSASTTEIYAESNEEAAIQAMQRHG